jgi:hypothetical protein
VEGHNVETGKHLVKKGAEVDARGKVRIDLMTLSSNCSQDNTTLYNVFLELTMCRTQQYVNLQWVNTAKAAHTVNTQKHFFTLF